MTPNMKKFINKNATSKIVAGGHVTSTGTPIRKISEQAGTEYTFEDGTSLIMWKEDAQSCPDFSPVWASVTVFDPEGRDKFPNITDVEVFLGGVGRLCFDDGTMQFADNETYPDVVYSPRLPPEELEQFCKDNRAKYEHYFESNFDAIDRGDELPAIDQFWL